VSRTAVCDACVITDIARATDADAVRLPITPLRIAWTEKIAQLLPESCDMGLTDAAVSGDQSRDNAVRARCWQSLGQPFMRNGLHAGV
jgi:hypothetical protein